MIKTGKLLSASPVTITDEKPKVESRMFKVVTFVALLIGLPYEPLEI